MLPDLAGKTNGSFLCYTDEEGITVLIFLNFLSSIKQQFVFLPFDTFQFTLMFDVF